MKKLKVSLATFFLIASFAVVTANATSIGFIAPHESGSLFFFGLGLYFLAKVTEHSRE